MAAGGTLTLSGGADVTFSTGLVYSFIVGVNSGTQGVQLNTTSQTLTVTNIDHLYGAKSATAKETVTLGGTSGNTLDISFLDTIIGNIGADTLTLRNTGNTIQVSNVETFIGSSTGTDLITLANTSGNTIAVSFIESLMGNSGNDVAVSTNTVGTTMAVGLYETIIGNGGLDLFASVAAANGNTALVIGAEVFLGSSTKTDVITLGGGGNTMGVIFLDTLIGGTGYDIVTNAVRSGTLNTSTGGMTLNVSGIEMMAGGTGARDTLILGDVNTTITIADIDTLIGSSGVDVVTIEERRTTPIIGDTALTAATSMGTMLVAMVETLIGTAQYDTISLSAPGSTNGNTINVSMIEEIRGSALNSLDDVVQIGQTGGSTTTIALIETLIGGNGNDVVQLGITATRGNTTLIQGIETVIGSANADTIQFTGAGTLTIAAVEMIIGANGADTVQFLSGTATTATIESIETLVGGDAANVISASQTAGSTLNVDMLGTLVGASTFDDVVILQSAATALTLKDIETIIGSAYQDVVQLAANTDPAKQTLVSGVEALIGSGHSAVLADNAGNTILVSGLSTLVGGSGLDVITLHSNGNTTVVSNVETVIGGSGTDDISIDMAAATLYVSGVETVRTASQTIAVGGVAQTIVIGGISNVLHMPASGGSSDVVLPYETVIGDGGTDIITLTQTQGTTLAVQLLETLIGSAQSEAITVIGNGGSTMQVSQIESLTGNSGNDTVLLGASGAIALAGIETAIGSSGVDIVTLAQGATITVAALETLTGSAQTDLVTIAGNGGSTMLISQVESLVGSGGADLVTLVDSGNTIGVSQVESVIGGSGVDSLSLGAGGNTIAVSALETLRGGSGTDIVTQLSSTGSTLGISLVETAIGGAGLDVVRLDTIGNTLTAWLLETIVGGLGGDVITVATAGPGFPAATGSINALIDGGSGNDILIGGAGNDTLIGGTGADTMTGGAGNDLFDVTNGDRITDFTDGVDTIRISGATYSIGDISVVDSGADAIVTIGSGTPVIITLTGRAGLASANFTVSNAGGATLITTAAVPGTPTDSDSTANSVVEGAANGTAVGLTVSEPNGLSGITYSLTDDAGGRFAIDATTGVVTVADGTKLDFETATSHTITVQASDGTATSSQTFTINVANAAPGQPTDSNSTANSVAEGAANGTAVGITASAADVNGGTVTYSLTDNAGGRFAIDATTGVVTVADGSKLDYETATSHTITVQASDGTATSSQNFTINVTNVAPGQPTDSNNTANSVAEGAANGTAVGITASATDVNGGTVTYSLTDNAGGRFAIDASTGVVTVADGSKLDYETATSHTITVQASDGTATSSQTFTVNVTNAPPSQPTDSNNTANSVAEGAANGTAVGITASAADPSGGTVTYSLTDNAGGRFAIDATTGVVTVADGTKLDYETATSHTITVQASDGIATSSQNFTINVANAAPGQPTDSNTTANSVAEGAANGTAVGITASATDVNGGTVTYSLTDNAGGRFAIDATTGVVTVADGTKLDYETATSHTITVQASDGTATSSQNFTINVTNVAPGQPTDSNNTANSVAEGAANGTAVGITAGATDVNGGTVTYSLTDNAGGRFAIDASTGVVTVADGSKLDYETATSHTITVQASDGTATSSQTFTVNVTNAPPSQPTDSNNTANSVAEGAANGTAVGITASAADPSGGTVTYSLTDNAGGRFAIDATTGVVTVADGTKLDYETATSHTITVQASDGTATSSQNFTINVANVGPTVPVDNDAAANSVAEGAANGTAVGITASATDVNGGTVTYSLTDNAGGRFAIDATTGVVTVADSTKLDFETATSHTITVQASDGAATSTQSFTINVTNAGPAAPVDSDIAANNVVEGASTGTLIGITANATDVNGGTLTYTLTDDAGGRFAIDATTGVVSVADGAKLDYETATSHTITVQASDGTATSSQSFTVNVTNAPPSQPTDGDVTDNSVAEGAANGTTVGITASATDPSGGTVTYSLTDDAGGRFAIDATTGVVTVADGAKLDYESATSHTITVQASDGTATSSQNFNINVANVSPTRPIDSNTASNSVAEGAANGTLVGITAISADPSGGTITYSLTDNAGGRFAIDATTGVITVADGTKLDYEAATSHTITVQATDGTAISTQNFTINVTNVAPTTPTDSNNTANSVAEGAANGTAVGITASATDINGGTVTYSLTDNAGGRFAIDATTGVVTVADSTKLDYETATSHTITVQASDGTATSSQTFTINVTNAAPAQPSDSNSAPNSVAEGAANGTLVGITATAQDPGGSAVTYSLTDNAGGRFAIDATTGVVTVADGSKLDYETATSHTITVQASDGTTTSSQTFTINVANAAPTTPTDSNNTANSVVEGAANGTAVGITVSATDVNGGTVTYSLTDNAGGRFAIDATTGVVTVADGSKLDYETATSHTITVQATDGTATSNQNFTINVANVAPTTPTDSNNTANSVAEGAANGTAVGITASATDVNGGTVTYSLTDNAGGRFAIDATTGVVTVADGTKLDFETATSHTITVQATDGTATSNQTFTINVTNVAPTTPVDANTATNTIQLGAAAGTGVGITANATDVNGTPVTYSLLADAGGLVVIDANSGVVSIRNGVDWSQVGTGNKTITVQASDGQGGLSQQDFSFNVRAQTGTPSTPTLAIGSDTGLSNSDGITRPGTLQLTGTAEAGATVTLFVNGNASGLTTVAGVDGTYGFNFDASALTGTVSFSATAIGTSGIVSEVSGPRTITLDGTAPTVSGVTLVGTPDAEATSLTWRVSFSEAVDGVTAGAFSLVTGGTAGGSIGAVTIIDSRTIEVTATGLTGNGTVTLNVGGTGIVDIAGNMVSAPSAGAPVAIGRAGVVAGSVTRDVTYLEDSGTVSLAGTVLTSAPAGATLTATLTLANPALGRIVGVGGTYDAATGVWRATGTLAQINAALAAVGFLAIANNDLSTSVRLLVTDNVAGNLQVSSTFNLTATPVNDAPVVGSVIGNQVASQGNAFALTVPSSAFSDVDTGDALTLSATLANGDALPSWLRFDPATGQFSGTPGLSDTGAVNITVTARDRAGASVGQTFALTIEDVLRLPAAGSTLSVDRYTTIIGDVGTDVITLAHIGGATLAVSGLETLIGSNGRDVITGIGAQGMTMSVSMLESLTGTPGTDVIYLGGASNTIWLQGIETLVGNSARDYVRLGDGGNNVTVSALETLIGGAGLDRVTLAGGATISVEGIESLIGGAGSDFVFTGSVGGTLTAQGIDVLVGGSGNDVIRLGDGGNSLLVRGVETLQGGAGQDIVTIGNSGATMSIASVETLVGGASRDVISLGNQGNTMQVSNIETLTGGTGADDITVTGNRGVRFEGGAGADRITLGTVSAADQIVYRDPGDGGAAGSNTGFDSIINFQTATDTLSLIGSLRSMLDRNSDGVVQGADRGTGQINLATDEVVRLTTVIDSLADASLASIRAAIGTVQNQQVGSSVLVLAGDRADNTGVYMVTKTSNSPDIAASEIRLLGVVSNARLNTGNITFG